MAAPKRQGIVWLSYIGGFTGARVEVHAGQSGAMVGVPMMLEERFMRRKSAPR